MKNENESEITSEQDQTLQTKYHATEILQTRKENKGRLRQESENTVQNIVSA